LQAARLGKLLEEPHEFFANFIAAFIFVHLSALWVHQRFGGVPVAQSMWTGVQVHAKRGEATHA